MLAGGTISWKIAKQTLITSCTMEAEFIHSPSKKYQIKEYSYETLSLDSKGSKELKDL